MHVKILPPLLPPRNPQNLKQLQKGKVSTGGIQIWQRILRSIPLSPCNKSFYTPLLLGTVNRCSFKVSKKPCFKKDLTLILEDYYVIQ